MHPTTRLTGYRNIGLTDERTMVKKGKVDNLYRGSIIDPIAAEPLLQYPPPDPCHWLLHTGALT